MVPAEILRKLELFDGLTADELNAVTGLANVVEYPKGSMIFKENESAEHLYVLLEGMVAIQFELARNQTAVVHTSTAGQAFGWSAMVQPYKFTASARCVADSKVVTVDGENIRKLAREDCHVGFVIMEKLAQVISTRLRETRMQLISAIHG
jgi:CRP-like cAMP-binding protein